MIQEKRFAAAAIAASACLALSWAPSVAIAHEAGVGALAAAVQADNGLPKTTEYHKVTGQIEVGETFTLVTTNGTPQRILHYTNGASNLDKCRSTSVGDKLTPIDCEVSSFTGTGAHQWTIEEAEGGYTIKSNTKNGKYLNVSENAAAPGDEAQVLKIQKTGEGTFSIGREVNGAMRYLTYNDTGAGSWTVGTEPFGFMLYQKVEKTPTVLPNEKPTPGTTQDQPFASGTAGSTYFRIPSLITLEDGTLFSAIDARWNFTGDAGGLDTIISTSSDGGKTWNYSFPNYFNDSTNAYNSKATAFIDPVTVEKDGTVYMMVDLWPGGVALNSAAHSDPINGSGYVEINGEKRLALYGSPVPSEQRTAGAEQGRGYTHYVGDFGADGFAPVIKTDGKTVEYYVDQDFYLFDANKEPMYCQQLGSSDYVQQNVFYYNADLHVMATSYLWLVTSSDGGSTWSHPQMLNEQVRTDLDEPNSCFYGVGPGRGLVTSSGRIILPCYTFKRGQGDGNTSVIYSDDGVTWHRSESLDHQTSEATVVEADGRLYLFARHGWYAVSTDGGATWGEEKSLADTGLKIDTGCQIDAITYSKKIDGKTAIILSCPSTVRRVNGTINVGLVQDDGSISWDYTFEVTKNGTWFAYSSMTELDDGSIGILYETTGDTVKYENFAIEDIAPNAQIGNECKLNIPLYGELEITVAGTLSGFEGVDSEILGITVEDNGDGTSTVTFTGKGEGTVEFVDPASGVNYIVVVAPEKLVEVSLESGESKVVDADGDAITRQPDESIASVELTTRNLSEVLGEVPGSLGTDNSFSGDAIPLSDALMTFKKKGDGWTVSGTTHDGKTAYLKLGKAGMPGQTDAGDIQLKQESGGYFKLYDRSSGKHLHFWRDGKHAFDQCGGTTCNDDKLELYRPAEASENTDESAVPGYVRISSADEIKDGGSYLVIATVGDERFALNPSVDQGNKYSHVVKVDPERTTSALKVTGIAPGVTDAMVGDAIYRITVNGHLAPEFVWAQDYQSAQAVFKRSDDGDPATVDCVVTSERTEPTATEDGKIVYTATVEFEGKTYTDVKTVVLPATGEPGDGGDTGNPDDGKPGDGKPGDSKPGDDVPTGSKPSKPSSALPQTGDPVAAVGTMSLLGSALAALGLRSKKRK